MEEKKKVEKLFLRYVIFLFYVIVLEVNYESDCLCNIK